MPILCYRFFAVLKLRSLEQVFVKVRRSAVDRKVRKTVHTSDGRDRSAVLRITSGIFRPKWCINSAVGS